MTVANIGPETGLKIIRGAVDTTGSGSILVGSGFTITRNGTGDVTVNFTVAFSTAPAVALAAGTTAGVVAKLVTTEPTTGAARVLVGTIAAGVATDGIFHFIAAGPR